MDQKKQMKLTCSKCGYNWFSRKKMPKACPRCKRYDWNTLSKDRLLKKKE